ncbi:MAG: hypothetical protein KIT63_23810 [Rhodoferax sp.]|nr:hypothetical protein [Rhodoferax sp.]
MTPVDLMRWTNSPELRALSLAARAAWLLLTMCGRPVRREDFVALAAVTPQQASAVLAELIEADLADFDLVLHHVVALPLRMEPPAALAEVAESISSPSEPDSNAAWLH